APSILSSSLTRSAQGVTGYRSSLSQFLRLLHVDLKGVGVDNDAIVGACALKAYISFEDIAENHLGITFQRIAVTAPAGRVDGQHVTRSELGQSVGISRRPVDEELRLCTWFTVKKPLGRVDITA